MDLFSFFIGFFLGALALSFAVKYKQKKMLKDMASVGKRPPKAVFIPESDCSDSSEDI